MAVQEKLKYVEFVYHMSRKYPHLTHLFSFMYPSFSKYEINKYHKLSRELQEKYGQGRTFHIGDEFGIKALDFKIEFHFSKIDDSILYSKFSEGEYYEKEVTNYILNNFHEGMSFLDVGANIGYFTLLAASISKKGTTYSIEANSEMYKELCRNIEVNEFENVMPFNIAAGNRHATVKMNEKAGLYSNATIVREKQGSLLDLGDCDVKMERLDEVLKLNKLDLVKMDIEGSEPIAIEGMSGLFSSGIRPNMIIEFNSAYNIDLLLSTIPKHYSLYEIWDNGSLALISDSSIKHLKDSINLCALWN